MPEKRVYLRRSQDIFREIEERRKERRDNWKSVALIVFGMVIALTGFWVAKYGNMVTKSDLRDSFKNYSDSIVNNTNAIFNNNQALQNRMDKIEEHSKTADQAVIDINDRLKKLGIGDVIIRTYVHDGKNGNKSKRNGRF